MSDLPAGWLETTLGEVVDYGKTEKVEPKNIPANAWILELEDIEKDTSRLLQRLTIEQRESKSTKNAFQKGDVLYGKLRPYLNKVIMADDDGFCTTEIIPIKPNTAIDGRYLFYWLKTPEFLSYVNSVSYGLNMPRLGTKDGLAAPLVLAPLDEQKRIAEKLDTLLTRVDSCERHLERVPQILKRFRQSVLAAATSGRLTEDWREEKGVNGEWETVQLSEVATSRLGKMLDVAKNRGELHPYLRNINVRWFAFDLSDVQELRISEEEAKSLGVRKGDVLICEGGEPGRCAVWNGEDDIYLFQKALHRVRVGEKLLPEWLCYCLKSSADSGKLAEYFTGTTIKHFTGVSLSRFEFDLPSLEEQAEIVRRVESLFAVAERLEARTLSASERVARLTPSLLAKGFRGELAGQGQG